MYTRTGKRIYVILLSMNVKETVVFLADISGKKLNPDEGLHFGIPEKEVRRNRLLNRVWI